MKNKIENIMDLKEAAAKGEIEKLHTARYRGYVSRRSIGEIKDYKGKFGTGYCLLEPAFDSTQYCWVTYFVWRKA